ncbi:hypothetical protein EHP00_958 [Ecytonucleospora hepatopenaei]|uniref:Uncharacterized protein n=1 Tax=Ecytonucleospora hepatopenaei TaxID=646526 RepID=A0A1W0E6N0_9MICR|nr:hypothetical protein EHP00_958 [Ecytonucleospora hepatopenaei]
MLFFLLVSQMIMLISCAAQTYDTRNTNNNYYNQQTQNKMNPAQHNSGVYLTNPLGNKQTMFIVGENKLTIQEFENENMVNETTIPWNINELYAHFNSSETSEDLPVGSALTNAHKNATKDESPLDREGKNTEKKKSETKNITTQKREKTSRKSNGLKTNTTFLLVFFSVLLYVC